MNIQIPTAGQYNLAKAADLDFSVVLMPDAGSYVDIATNGASSIGFRLVPPTGSVISFESSWDGIAWEVLTLRQMGSDGYSSWTSIAENWIGSIAAVNYVRFRTTTQGSSAGSVIGRRSNIPCTLEGVEHGNMPHRIGAAAKTASFSYSNITTDHVIYTPPTNRRVVITDLHFTVSDTPTVVIFSDGAAANGYIIFKGAFKPANAQSVFVPISYTLPHVFSAVNRPLMFSQTAASGVTGTIHMYDSE